MFCERLRVRRIDAWRELPDAVECVKTGSVYAKYRIVYRNNNAVYVNMRDVRNFTIEHFMREALDRYTYVTDFVQKATASAARAEQVPLTVTPYTSAELDRVLNVAQAMGQWAWAYCVLLDVLGISALNARNVVWDGFPHLSRIGVWHGGRIIWLAGAARQVLEFWFVAHGGYHSPHAQYVDDRANYDRACHGIASPWAVADVPRTIGSLQAEWLPADLPRNVVKPTPGDACCEGVVYRANAEGKLLPVGFAPPNVQDMPTCPRTAWLLEDRIQLVARMAVPLQLRQEVLHGKAE